MANFPAMTLKLVKAIKYKHGMTLLYSTEQKVSEKTGNVYTEYRLSLNVTVAEYNKMYPAAKKDPAVYKSKYVKLTLIKTIKSRDLFMSLLHDIWEKLESGEAFQPENNKK